MKRVLGLDFGSKTVGVAVSDPLLITAQAVETIRRKSENKLRKTYARITALIEELDIGTIVVGLPKYLNGDEGERVGKTLEFKETLERYTKLDVVTWDERLSTVEALRTLDATGASLEKKKEVVDMVAAQIILQGYLDSIKMSDKGDANESKDNA